MKKLRHNILIYVNVQRLSTYMYMFSPASVFAACALKTMVIPALERRWLQAWESDVEED